MVVNTKAASADRFNVVMLVIMTSLAAVIGTYLVLTALEGSGIIPNFLNNYWSMLGYTAGQAVVTLLVGQTMLALACGFGYALFVESRRGTRSVKRIHNPAGAIFFNRSDIVRDKKKAAFNFKLGCVLFSVGAWLGFVTGLYYDITRAGSIPGAFIGLILIANGALCIFRSFVLENSAESKYLE